MRPGRWAHELVVAASSSRLDATERSTTESDIAADITNGVPNIDGAGIGQSDLLAC